MSTIRQEFTARAEQRMALLPRMLQSIEILQLATADLLTLIDSELEQNEALELVRREGGMDERDERRARRAGAEDDSKLAMLSAAPDRGPDLYAHICSEVGLLDLSPALRAKVLALAERLDEGGFLTETDAELAEALGGEDLLDALAVLRSIEPRGIGARGPIDAMLLQLDDADPDRPQVALLLEQHLAALARNRLDEVAAAIGVDAPELRGLLARIEGLDPRPGARFGDTDVPSIRADLLVRTVDGRVEVVVDDLALPILDVSADYARMARDTSVPKDVRVYLGGKVRSARELIAAVESRKRTLCVVGAAILAAQPGFLTYGRRSIRPLRMSDIAARVELHTSTVSRAIAGKHLGCDHGIVALREFFDGGRVTEDSSRGRTAILELIRDVIAAEDPATPWTDDVIAARLAARGVRVARRTVAKYRAQLGIRSVSLRRRPPI